MGRSYGLSFVTIVIGVPVPDDTGVPDPLFVPESGVTPVSGVMLVFGVPPVPVVLPVVVPEVPLVPLLVYSVIVVDGFVLTVEADVLVHWAASGSVPAEPVP